LIIFSRIGAPIVAPSSDDFSNLCPTERAYLPLKSAASIVKIGVEKPTLRLAELIHYVTDTVEERQRENTKKHYILLPHTDVRCSISAKLCTMLEEVRAQ